MTKLVRVKKPTFEKLVHLAGKLQIRLKRVVTLDEAINYSMAQKEKDVKAFLQKISEKKQKPKKRRKMVHIEMNQTNRREVA
ncbi:MAG: hypothetical protein V1811_02085 [Candidatus Micrarchaeota archaeon]